MVSNPLRWILSDEEAINNFTHNELYENFSFDIQVTMNGIHWINAGSYKYYKTSIIRIVYVNFPDKSTLEDRIKILKAEDQNLTNEEKIGAGFIPNNLEDKKKKEELSKKISEEDNIVKTVARRPYSGIFVYGEFFPKPENKNNVSLNLYLFMKKANKA